MTLSVSNNRAIYLNGMWSSWKVEEYNPTVIKTYAIGDHMRYASQDDNIEREYECIQAYTSTYGLPDLTKWRVTESTSLDLTMMGTTPIPYITPKTSEIDIPTADGTIDLSRESGRLHFNSLVISYVFTHIISRYDETKPNYTRRSLNEMNRLVNAHKSLVQNWVYAPEEYDYDPQDDHFIGYNPTKFYDTGICTVAPTQTNSAPAPTAGYWLANPRCSNFAFSKNTSDDVWVLQYQIEITTDPWMYEYNANPKTYTMFSGPTFVNDSPVSAKIYSEAIDPEEDPPTEMRRRLWTNDNVNWIPSTSAAHQGGYWATWSFTPQVAPIYKGDIGVYMNFYVEYTYNDITYKYHIDNTHFQINRGTYNAITSSKISTPNEMGYTDENGFDVYAVIIDDGTNPLSDLITATNGHIPLPFTWGVVKSFITASSSVPFMLTAKGPGTKFKRITDASGGTIYYNDINFGDTFYLDNDPYNELEMYTHDYGFYSLESPDNARRRL